MNATATATRHPEMLEKIEKGQGFIAALDQSGGSTPGALKAYGIGEDAFSNDEEMFRLVHQMRSRIITAPSFGSGKVIGAILFEKTMDGEANGKPVPRAAVGAGRGSLPESRQGPGRRGGRRPVDEAQSRS